MLFTTRTRDKEGFPTMDDHDPLVLDLIEDVVADGLTTVSRRVILNHLIREVQKEIEHEAYSDGWAACIENGS